MRRPVVPLLIAHALVVAIALAGAPRGGDALDDLPRPTPATEHRRAHDFDVERIATGLNRPVWVGAAPGEPRALWVLEQPGRVIRIADGLRTTVLDISGQVLIGAEQGLLGI